MPRTETHRGVKYNASHNSPFDRGESDSYYQRPMTPHKRVLVDQKEVKVHDITDKEYIAYVAGYAFNEENQTFKEWE
tara:strand:+ start:287 stop:517 length:231 start_codon:yes stop_codon:yes gene_type:complete